MPKSLCLISCLLTFATSLALAADAPAAKPTTQPASPHRYLFLAPERLQVTGDVAARINPPQQREIVIRRDRPWEKRQINLFLTVMEDQGKLRMWYTTRLNEKADLLAYAESTDGVHWTKPNLGSTEFEGAKENNLVGIKAHEGTVLRDPHARTPDETYVYVTHISGKGIVRYTSPDGLRWKCDAEPLLPFRADTQNVVLWDPNLQSYVLYLRGWNVDVEGNWKNRMRRVMRTTAKDLSKPIPIHPTPRGNGPRSPQEPAAICRRRNRLPYAGRPCRRRQ